ncbi:MAG: type II secretion system protein [Candidatus Gastranaerophilales bacterium]|nr:type II secretion system protein [Candidatus Gastranaerophilales bacterium]
MRLKKGFTLAEILIVLMVIGVIATMTIPSMMKGVAEAQLKAGYKKAFNTIVNFAAMEKISGTLPAKPGTAGVEAIYSGLNSSLSVKEYATDTVNSGIVPVGGNAATCLQIGDATLGTASAADGAESNCAVVQPDQVAEAGTMNNKTKNLAWVVTDDGMAYSVMQGASTNAAGAMTKQEINATANDAAAVEGSSAVIIVDVNGIGKGPNLFEKQGYDANNQFAATEALDTITGDRYKIYIGSDGATAGPRGTTVTGRMVADAK